MYRSRAGKGKGKGKDKAKAKSAPAASEHDRLADAVAADVAAITSELQGGSGRKGSHHSSSAGTFSSTSAGEVAHHHNAAAASAATAATTSPMSGSGMDAMSSAIVRFKAEFTTPSMVYSPTTRAIEANPGYNKAVVAGLSRAQGAMLGALRHAQQHRAAHTPKELLHSLERALLFLLASTAVGADSDPLPVAASEHDPDAGLPTLEGYFAHHRAPAKAIAATAYALSEGVTRRAVDSYLHALAERIAVESEPVVEKHRSQSERRAFAATRNNMQDFVQVHSNFLVAYDCIPRSTSGNSAVSAVAAFPGSAAATMGQPVSAATQAASAGLLSEAYYSLLRWVLAVDPERRALQRQAAEKNNDSPSSSVTGVVVTEYDAYEGRVSLSRPRPTTPWGCVFNGDGYLVGVSNELRNSGEAGARLFTALQQRSGAVIGLPVLEANRRRIRSLQMSAEELAAQRGNITAGLRDSLTSDARTLHLLVPPESQAALTAPQEVVFEPMVQGGENASGQQALLVLRRANTAIPWGVKMVKDGEGTLKLQEFSDNIRLSARAKDFLFDHRGGLSILGLNHRELGGGGGGGAAAEPITGAGLRAIISNSLVMALWIQVSDTPGAAAALPRQEPEEEEAEEQQEEEAPEEEEEEGKGEEEEAAEEAPAEIEEEAVEETADADADAGKLSAEDAVDAAVRAAMEGDGDVAAVEANSTTATTTTTARVTRSGASKEETIASIRRGWSLDDDKQERQQRALLEENGVATDAVDEEAEEAADAIEGEGEAEGEAVATVDTAVITGNPPRVKMTPAEKKRALAEKKRAVVQRKKDALRRKREIKTAKAAAAKAKKAGTKLPKSNTDAAVEGAEEEEADPAVAEGEGAVPVSGEEPPLVQGLRTSAEAAIETGESSKSKSKGKKEKESKEDKKEAVKEAEAAKPVRVSISELVEAAPLTFPNEVVMNRFDGSHMTLERPNVSLPWQIKVGFSGDDMVLTGLPANAGDAGVPAGHPYLRFLEPYSNPDHNNSGSRCLVENINGIELSTVTKANRNKVFDAIKKSAKLEMVLRFLRK